MTLLIYYVIPMIFNFVVVKTLEERGKFKDALWIAFTFWIPFINIITAFIGMCKIFYIDYKEIKNKDKI